MAFEPIERDKQSQHTTSEERETQLWSLLQFSCCRHGLTVAVQFFHHTRFVHIDQNLIKCPIALFWQERYSTSNASATNITSNELNWMQEFWQNFLALALCGTILLMSTGTRCHQVAHLVSVTPWLERYCCKIHILGYTSMSGTVVMFVIVSVLSYQNISNWA